MEGAIEKSLSYHGYTLVDNRGNVLHAFSMEQVCDDIRNVIEKDATIGLGRCRECSNVGCYVQWRIQRIFPQFCHEIPR